MTSDGGLVDEVRAALAACGDLERAAGQQRYMKSEMPYLGLTSPRLKATLAPILAGHPLADRATWADTVRELFDDAAYREERYAAIALARHRSARGWQDPGCLDLYRHLIETGAWWDLVDEIAAHLVGGILASHRAAVTPTMRAWAADDALWVRRAAVLCQLRHGPETDTDLLHDVITANLDDRSFWLRKAIGWALRQYARVDAPWVRAEVADLGDRLSPLSRREALKHL